MKRGATGPWMPPGDIDPACVALCVAMNAVRGIYTLESCCGHDKEPFQVFFRAERMTDLPRLCYWFSACHSGVSGWIVRAKTDCGMSPVLFVAEGPVGDYAGANSIATAILEDS